MISISGAKKAMASVKAEAREPSRATKTLKPPRARAMSAMTRASKPSGARVSSRAPGARVTRLAAVAGDESSAILQPPRRVMSYVEGRKARSRAMISSSKAGGTGAAPDIQL